MKKITALLLTFVLAFACMACGSNEAANNDADVKSEGVMTYAEYAAAALDTEVVVETYVQAKQSWWENKATIYTQDKDGAYFIYEMACTEADAAKIIKTLKTAVSDLERTYSSSQKNTKFKL